MTPIDFPRISKRVGWSSLQQTAWPTQAEADKLLAQVTAGSESALEMVLRIYRFSPSPINDGERDVCKTIARALTVGRDGG